MTKLEKNMHKTGKFLTISKKEGATFKATNIATPTTGM